jgi:hypothetical protein
MHRMLKAIVAVVCGIAVGCGSEGGAPQDSAQTSSGTNQPLSNPTSTSDGIPYDFSINPAPPLFGAPVHSYPHGWNFGNPGPWETIVGDFNGDGRTDYGRLGGTYAHFFFSNGDGTFSNPIHYYPSGWNFGFDATWPAIVGDFNGDGRTDYGRLGGTYAHFFFSNGDGTFSNPIHYYPPGWNFGNPSAWETIVGDFNGDGRTDYGRMGGTYTHFFFSNGDGTFSSPVHHYPSGWNFGFPSAWDAIVGDFNGDLKTDYARIGSTYAHFFFSNGDGTFSNPIHYYPSGWNFGFDATWPAIVGDFNGDGRTDYGRLGGTYAHFFFSNGDGTFSSPVHFYPEGWNFGNPGIWETIVGDFNGDGRTDYGRLGGTEARFFLSNGNGTFSNPIHFYPPSWNFGFDAAWPAIVGNFNGDLKTDYARLGGTYSHFFLKL